MKAPENWDEQDLLELIRIKQEETLQLEFKEAGALQQNDKKKQEISKDVSAFANSAGGTIVYGMEEHPKEPHYAKALSPIDPNQALKE